MNKITVIFLEKSKSAGPSDGKNDKVSPIFRFPVLATLARTLMVPPYRFLPASHTFGLFKELSSEKVQAFFKP